MKLSKKMINALNKQLEMEASAQYKYLAMASWCEREALDGAAEFFYQHAAEEHQHFMKIFLYINETGAHAITPAVPQPKLDYKSIQEMCKIALKNEEAVSASIHKIADLANQEKDHVTYDFLRFFIEEQREEEVLFQKVIDRIELIGEGGQSLYYIDAELKKLGTEGVTTA